MRSWLPLAFLAVATLAPAQTARLQLKFPKGKVDRLITTTKMTQSMSVPGGTQSMSFTLDQSASMLLRVLESGPSGAAMRMTYENVKSSSVMDGKPMPANDDIAKQIRGLGINLRFAPNGALMRIEGVKELLAKVTQTSSPAMKQAFEQMFDERSIREMWSTAFGTYPTRPVKVGDKWTSKQTYGKAPMQIGVNVTMTLRGLERRHGHQMARISITGTGSVNMSGMAQGVSMKTNQVALSGTSYFDLDRGWMTEQALTMTVKGAMLVNSGGRTQSSNISMAIRSTSQLISVK